MTSGLQVRARRVQRGRVAGRAAADDDDVLDLGHGVLCVGRVTSLCIVAASARPLRARRGRASPPRALVRPAPAPSCAAAGRRSRPGIVGSQNANARYVEHRDDRQAARRRRRRSARRSCRRPRRRCRPGSGSRLREHARRSRPCTSTANGGGSPKAWKHAHSVSDVEQPPERARRARPTRVARTRRIAVAHAVADRGGHLGERLGDRLARSAPEPCAQRAIRRSRSARDERERPARRSAIDEPEHRRHDRERERRRARRRRRSTARSPPTIIAQHVDAVEQRVVKATIRAGDRRARASPSGAAPTR